MKSKHLMTLLQEGFTTIKVQFYNDRVPVEPSSQTIKMRNPSQNAPWDSSPFQPMPAPPMPGTQQAARVYTYKVELSDNIEVGNVVAVKVGGDVVLAKVVEVHDLPQIDLDADFDYRWIVQKIDFTHYDEVAKREAEFNQAMVEVERVKQREKVKRDMEELLGDSPMAKQLFNRAIKSLNDVIDGEAKTEGSSENADS